MNFEDGADKNKPAQLYKLGQLVDAENDLFTINVLNSRDVPFIGASLDEENFLYFEIDLKNAEAFGNNNYTIEI